VTLPPMAIRAVHFLTRRAEEDLGAMSDHHPMRGERKAPSWPGSWANFSLL
jgi:hypothetical protein